MEGIFYIISQNDLTCKICVRFSSLFSTKLYFSFPKFSKIYFSSLKYSLHVTIYITMKSERKYVKDYIECTFCGKSCNLNSCNKHLNSKSCKKFQDNDEKKTEKYFAFRKIINQLREKIKNEVIK